MPSTEGEKKAADLSAKMRQSAEEVFGMSFGEKAAWALERRKAGNDLFASGEFQEAMDVYMTVLVAVSKEADEEKESDERVALPVLLNLAQCALNLGNASKVVAFCDHAMSLKSGTGARSAKVHYRRGKGRLMVGDYRAARADLEAALELCQEDDEERRAVERELKKLKVRSGEGSARAAKDDGGARGAKDRGRGARSEATKTATGARSEIRGQGLRSEATKRCKRNDVTDMWGAKRRSALQILRLSARRLLSS